MTWILFLSRWSASSPPPKQGAQSALKHHYKLFKNNTIKHCQPRAGMRTHARKNSGCVCLCVCAYVCVCVCVCGVGGLLSCLLTEGFPTTGSKFILGTSRWEEIPETSRSEPNPFLSLGVNKKVRSKKPKAGARVRLWKYPPAGFSHEFSRYRHHGRRVVFSSPCERDSPSATGELFLCVCIGAARDVRATQEPITRLQTEY